VTTILVTIFIFMTVTPALSIDLSELPRDLIVGPYVSTVIYNVIIGADSRVDALRDGSVDIIGMVVEPDYIPILQADADISLTSTLRNGYGHFTINCDKYPLNIKALRRAFAYAFDKSRVSSEVFGGLSQEHDSVVPYANIWCIEDDLPYHYYTAQVATGNQILEDAGFEIDPGTGFRLAPDGSPFQVFIECPTGTPEASAISWDVCQIGLDALTSLDIGGNVTPIAFDDMMTKIDNNEDFDMAFFAYDFPDFDVYWLADHFWGEVANVQQANPTCL
jgi:ABC-type transport system substrate-binding protein